METQSFTENVALGMNMDRKKPDEIDNTYLNEANKDISLALVPSTHDQEALDISNQPPDLQYGTSALLDLLEEDRQGVQNQFNNHDEDQFLNQPETSGILEYIFLNNFKSYKGLHKIGPFSKFCGIIGPNGSGKSNLMDAISFVLGVQSKHLRGVNMKDLIYQNKTGMNYDDSFGASVAILFKMREDNSIVEFSRRISANGVGSFHINGKPTTWKHYCKRLEKIGILVQARNFLVFQGDVEEVTQKSSLELTRLFEQISRSEHFKEDFERLQSEWRQNQMESRHAYLKKRQIEVELKELTKQKDELDVFVMNKKKLEFMKTEYYMFKIFLETDLLRSEKKRLESIKNDKNNCELKLFELKEDLQSFQMKKAAINVQIRNCSKKEEELRLSIDSALSRLTKNQETITFSNEQVGKAKVKMTKVHNNIESIKDSKNKILLEIKNKEDQLKEHKFRLEQAESHFPNLTKKQRQEYDALEKTFLERYATQTLLLDALLEKKDYIYRQIETKSEEIDAEQRKQARLKDALEQAKNQEDSLSSELLKHSDLENNLQNEKNDIEEKFQNASQAYEKLLMQKGDIDKKLKSFKSAQNELKRIHQSMKLVKELQDRIPGVYGQLNDICKVTRKKFERAAAAALGYMGSCIVVDSSSTAIACIEYLKANRFPRMEFLPLLDMVSKNSFTIFDNLHIKGTPAIDCITFDEMFRPALQHVLLDCLVVNNIADAQKIAYGQGKARNKWRIVTLSGVKILKNGNIISSNENYGASRLSFDFAEYQHLEKLSDSTKMEIRKIDDLQSSGTGKIEQIMKDLIRIQRAKQQIEAKLAVWKQQANFKSQELQQCSENLKMMLDTVENLKQQHDVESEMHLKHSKEMKECEKIIFSSLSSQLGLENIRQSYNEILSAKSELHSNDLKIKKILNRLRNDLSTMDERLNQLQHESDQEVILGKVYDIEKLQQECTFDIGQINELKEQFSAMENKAKTYEKDRFELDQNTVLIYEQFDSYTSKLDHLQARLNIANDKIQSSCTKITQIRQQATMEAVSLDMIQTLSDEQADNLDSNFTPDVEFSFDKLDSRLIACAADPAATIEELEKFESTIHEESEKLEGKNPNFKAFQKCDQLAASLAELEETAIFQRRKCSESEKRFRQIQKERCNAFMKCFEHVRAAIDKIYYNLTLSASESDVGGQAFLDIDESCGFSREEDAFLCGIKYHTMPPSKRFRDMQQLSGGEKTMAALALLFALQSFNPSPFYVLDEVDAALDSKNVKSLAYYLEKTSFQSIVISLKDRLFSRVDNLLGIFKDRQENTSRHLYLNLTQYDDAEIADNGSIDENCIQPLSNRSVDFSGSQTSQYFDLPGRLSSTSSLESDRFVL